MNTILNSWGYLISSCSFIQISLCTNNSFLLLPKILFPSLFPFYQGTQVWTWMPLLSPRSSPSSPNTCHSPLVFVSEIQFSSIYAPPTAIITISWMAPLFLFFSFIHFSCQREIPFNWRVPVTSSLIFLSRPLLPYSSWAILQMTSSSVVWYNR